MCTRCHLDKPTSEFSPSKQHRSGLFPWCKPCKSRYQAEYMNGLTKEERSARQRAYKEQRDSDRERRKRYLRNCSMYSLKKRYGITQHEAVELADHQGGVCAICGIPPDPSKKRGMFNVDHDHATGVVRGLLCEPCNLGLGFFMDDTDRLMAAIRYLQSPPYSTAVFTEALSMPPAAIPNPEKSATAIIDLLCRECGKSLQRKMRTEFYNRSSGKEGPFCGRACYVKFRARNVGSERTLVHGTATGYSYGCRCSLCRKAHTEAARNRRLRSR